MSDLRQSPLHAEHEKLGASVTAFGPWPMPLQYGQGLDEHHDARHATGLFDLSHVGAIWVNGADAAAFLSYALISNMDTVKNGKSKYSMIVAEDGGIIDDLISYRFTDTKFLVVPNAGNTDAVWEAFNQRTEGFDVELNNESLDVAMIALQGPNAAKVLVEQVAEDSKEEVENLPYYAATMAKVAGI